MGIFSHIKNSFLEYFYRDKNVYIDFGLYDNLENYLKLEEAEKLSFLEFLINDKKDGIAIDSYYQRLGIEIDSFSKAYLSNFVIEGLMYDKRLDLIDKKEKAILMSYLKDEFKKENSLEDILEYTVPSNLYNITNKRKEYLISDLLSIDSELYNYSNKHLKDVLKSYSLRNKIEIKKIEIIDFLIYLKTFGQENDLPYDYNKIYYEKLKDDYKEINEMPRDQYTIDRSLFTYLSYCADYFLYKYLRFENAEKNIFKGKEEELKDWFLNQEDVFEEDN